MCTSQSEFLSAARQCLDAERAAAARDAALTDALARVQRFMSRETVGAMHLS